MGTKVADYYIEIGERSIPVYVIIERRRDCRAYIGKTGVRIRVSTWFSAAEREVQINDMLVWAEQKLRERPEFAQPDKPRIYRDGDTILLNGQAYWIRTGHSRRKHELSAEFSGFELYITTPEYVDPAEGDEDLSKLMAKLVGGYFLKEVQMRVRELNYMHFNRFVGKVRLRNNRSNWGSCSTTGNISLSSRLLLTPPEVMDYVIIHELAHLIQHNHSRAFWQLVEQAMPDYKRHVKWLRKHGSECYF